MPLPPGGQFEHLVLLGGPSSLADVIADLGLARKISCEPPASRCADALAILEDGPVDLAFASRCLRPGAALYWEVTLGPGSFWRSGPEAVRRALSKSGFVAPSLYWAQPSFGSVSAYLPVEARRVLGWYADSFMDQRTFARRAGGAILKLLFGNRAPWLFGRMHRFAVTAVFQRSSDGTTLGRIPQAPEVDDLQEKRIAVILGGRDSSRRVVLFPFSRDAEQPSSAIKLWRLEDRNENTESEQDLLNRIRSGLDAGARDTIPEPRGTLRWGKLVASMESYAPGPSLYRRMDAWGRPLRFKIDDLNLVIDQIAEFHRQAQLSRGPWNEKSLRDWVDEPLTNYQSAFGLQSDEGRLFDDVRARSRALIGLRLPVVWAHPDLTAANIHLDGSAATVIDWSGATGRLPFFDLLYFVWLWHCHLRKRTGTDLRLRSFRELFIEDEADQVVQAIHRALARYRSALEIDPRFFPVLLTLSWVFRSLDSFQRARAAARGEPGVHPHPGESYVAHIRLLAEARQRHFSESDGLVT